jgi:hypothetical protein
MQKIVPLLFLFVGESLAIWSEIIAAKNIDTFTSTFWKMSGVMALAGLLLVAGYMFGVKYWHNIWIVGAVSIASIIIMEPIITFTLSTSGQPAAHSSGLFSVFSVFCLHF